METFGAIGEAALKFMKDVGQHISAVTLDAASQRRNQTWQCCLRDRNGAVVHQSPRTISFVGLKRKV